MLRCLKTRVKVSIFNYRFQPFSAIFGHFNKETTLVTSCLLSCTPSRFSLWSKLFPFSEREELAPKGDHIISFSTKAISTHRHTRYLFEWKYPEERKKHHNFWQGHKVKCWWSFGIKEKCKSLTCCKKSRCHTHLTFSANQITSSRPLIPIHILNVINNKQCISRSFGFFFFRIYTVCKGTAYPRSAGLELTCFSLQAWKNLICNFLFFFSSCIYKDHLLMNIRYMYRLFSFYGTINSLGPCRARSVYLTTLLLGRLSPLSGWPVLCTFFRQKLPFLNQRKGENDRRKYFMINVQ